MIDRPAAPDLLRAMAIALTSDVVANTTGQAQYTARIVANLCRILGRESELSPQTPGAAESAAALEDQIRRETFEQGDGIYQTLLADVERRLTIARPEYL